MRRSAPILAFLSLASIATAVGCSAGKSSSSNLSESFSESESMIQNRLNRTHKMRKIVRTIDEVLQPVDGTLGDIQVALKKAGVDLPTSLKDGEQMMVREVRRYFKKLQSDLVNEREDGTWSHEKSITWPAGRVSNRGGGQSCEVSTLGIEGRDLEKGAQSFSAYVLDVCTSDDPMVFLSGDVNENGEMNAHLSLRSLEPMLKHNIQRVLGECLLESGDGVQTIACDPFSETVENYTITFTRLKAEHSKMGTAMDLVIDVSRVGDGPVAQVTAYAEMGESVKVRVKKL